MFNKLKDSVIESKHSKFIWGVTSIETPFKSSANLYTVNDIEIIYFKKPKLYSLSINTGYIFDSYETEKEYLQCCLLAFGIFMEQNGYSTEEDFVFYLSSPSLTMTSDNIEHLYTQFKIFVNGY